LYWLNQEGFVKSRLFVDMGQDWEARQYHYHKLFVIAGALGISVFGFELTMFRWISMVCFIVFIGLLWLFVKQHREGLTSRDYFIILLLLLCHSSIFQFSFTYRPEVMVMMFGFASFVLLCTAKQSTSLANVVFSAIFAGLAAFTHLNGLIFIAAGFVVLVLDKHFKQAITFGFVGSLTALLYLYDINGLAEFSLLKQQLFEDPNILEKDYQAAGIFIKLLKEHERFFHSPQEISFSVLFFLAIYFNFKKIIEQYRRHLFYLIVLVVSLALLSHGKTEKYAIIYYPHMAFFIMLWIKVILDATSKIEIQRKFLVTFLVLYVGIQSHYFYDIIIKHEDVAGRAKQISQSLPKDCGVLLAYDGFIFNEIDNHKIDGYLGYLWYHSNYIYEDPSAKSFFEFVNRHDYKCIVIDLKTGHDFTQAIGIIDANIGEQYDSYQVTAVTDSYVTLKSTAAD